MGYPRVSPCGALAGLLLEDCLRCCIQWCRVYGRHAEVESARGKHETGAAPARPALMQVTVPVLVS